MNILITGKNGFIGSSFKSLITNYNTTFIGGDVLNLTNSQQVTDFFKDNLFDVVIHTAISGGKRLIQDSSIVLQNNLTMFFNILSNKHRFGKLIQFGSGAEFNRFNGKHINEFSTLNSSFPTDEYGMSKNIISRICQMEKDCYTLRLYNVFGFGESPGRMISGNINRYINNQDITVIKNKFMDFFTIEDLAETCKYFIDNSNLPKEIDCCYSDKLTLKQIADKINKLGSHSVNIHVEQDGMDLSYCGNGQGLSCLPLNLTGLDCGLQKLYQTMKNY